MYNSSYPLIEFDHVPVDLQTLSDTVFTITPKTSCGDAHSIKRGTEPHGDLRYCPKTLMHIVREYLGWDSDQTAEPGPFLVTTLPLTPAY